MPQAAEAPRILQAAVARIPNPPSAAAPAGAGDESNVVIRTVGEPRTFPFLPLGPGEPPAFPHFDCFIAPESHTFAFKGLIDCNWLQSLEVGIDPVHTSFLHRFFNDEDPSQGYGKMFRDTSRDSDMPMTQIMREFTRPRIEVEPTEFGFRLVTLRQISEASAHVRVTNLMFPNAFIIPMSREMTISQWHVPIDDEKHYWYAIFTSFGEPVDHRQMREQRLQLYELPDYRPRIGRQNNYGYDIAEQKTRTFTGMGFDINVHDLGSTTVKSPFAVLVGTT